MDKDLPDQQLPSSNQDPESSVVEQDMAEDGGEEDTASAANSKAARNAPKKRRSLAKRKRVTHVKSHRANVNQVASRKKKSSVHSANNENTPELDSQQQASDAAQDKSNARRSARLDADQSAEHASAASVPAAGVDDTSIADAPDTTAKSVSNGKSNQDVLEKTADMVANNTPIENASDSTAELDVNQTQERTAANFITIEEGTSNDQSNANSAGKNQNESPRFGSMNNLHVDADGNPLENPTRPQYLDTDLELSSQFLSLAAPVLMLPFGGILEIATDYGSDRPGCEDY